MLKLTVLLLMLIPCNKSLGQQKAEKSHLIVENRSEQPRNGEGAMLSLANDELCIVYTQWYTTGGDNHALGEQVGDHAPARLVSIMSKDRGVSWSSPVVVQENTGDMNVMSASLVRTASGRILLLYIKVDSNRDSKMWMKESLDEARTWGEPVCISGDETSFEIAVNSAAILLESGRIVLAAYRSPSAWGEDEHFKSFVFFSDNEGQTWKRSEDMVDCPQRGAMEPVIVQCSDGRIMMLIRTQMGEAYRSFSHDEGVTWEEAKPTGIIHPEAPLQIARIPGKDDLVLVWNNAVVSGAPHQGPRRPLTIAVSQDQGKTWQGVRDLESGTEGSYCYATLAFSDDALMMAYYAPAGLKFRSIPLSELYP